MLRVMIGQPWVIVEETSLRLLFSILKRLLSRSFLIVSVMMRVDNVACRSCDEVEISRVASLLHISREGWPWWRELKLSLQFSERCELFFIFIPLEGFMCFNAP